MRRTTRHITRFMAAFTVATTLCVAACGSDDATNNAGSSEKSSALMDSESASASRTQEAKITPLNAAANPNPTAMANLPQSFDLQSHRFGRGEWTEESAAGLKHSLELGVTTLEFDIVMSADGVPVVWHDPEIQEDKCVDTQPATPNDPQFPYVGKLVHELSFEQISTLNCNKKLDNFPDATAPEDNRLLSLAEVFELTAEHKNVYYNIETKIEAEEPQRSAAPQEFVDAILTEVNRAGVENRVMIQSFDWRSLPLVQEKNSAIPLVMLWDETTWKKDSAWTGDIDYSSVEGNIIKAAQQLGVQVLSPGHAVPYGAKPEDKDYNPTATPELISSAHEAGMVVVPWTVNDESTMREQILAGVDGLITDYPTRLRALLEELNINYR